MRATFDRLGAYPARPYRPVVLRDNGTRHTFGRNIGFPSKTKAIAFAQNWIDGFNRDAAIMAAHGYNPLSGGVA